jgi:acetylornithine deacetylase/succinyl-diaminopimelate desuccinylase-like protein
MPAAIDPSLIDRRWEEDVLPALCAYTRVPCLSPAFDRDWMARGEIQRAAALLADWVRGRGIPGLTVEVVAPSDRTPALLLSLPASNGASSGDSPQGRVPGAGPQTRPADTAGHGAVLVYGHLDKQPPQGEWRAGLGPFEPVREGDRLYGRGTADDGYSVFAAVTALEALGATDAAHGPVRVLIEASEESGSPDLDAHLDALAPRIGRPDLVLCLDSGCLTYDRLWVTTSLRGNLVVTVRIDVLEEGVHSGLAGGIVPSSFRVLRQLLSRVEDERTGEILVPELQAEIPASQQEALAAVAAEFPGASAADLPVVPGLLLGAPDEAARLLARAWRPALAVTGMAGIPAPPDAGNVLRPFTAAKLSIRLPPTVDARAAADALVKVLTGDPPEGARVSVELETPADGWVAPEPAPWLAVALAEGSRLGFGVEASAYADGGTIPFLAALGARFPGVQMVATGVLGPHSNAHGPNEFLHLPTAKGVTAAVAHLITTTPAPGPDDPATHEEEHR